MQSFLYTGRSLGTQWFFLFPPAIGRGDEVRLPRSQVLSVCAAAVAFCGVIAATEHVSGLSKTADSGQRSVNNGAMTPQTSTSGAAETFQWIDLSQGQQHHTPPHQPQRIMGRVETTVRSIPFRTVRRESSQLYRGQSRVTSTGSKGVLQVSRTHVYQAGRLISYHVSQLVVKHPVDEVILIGTRPRPPVARAPAVQQAVYHKPALQKSVLTNTSLSGRSGSSGFTAMRELTVVATAYCEGGTTATGVPAVPGVIAVDPRVIPLGTKLYIPGIGVVRAEDTGGAIIGSRIDICMATQQAADAWGVRTIQIYEIK